MSSPVAYVALSARFTLCAASVREWTTAVAFLSFFCRTPRLLLVQETPRHSAQRMRPPAE